MSIDCTQFEDIVHELERPGTRGFEMRAAAEAHAESCKRCGALLEKVMSLDSTLDRLAIEDCSARAPGRVETALLAEFRRQHAEPPAKRGFRLTAALAMAAAVILAIGISARQRHWMVRGAKARTAEIAAKVAPETSAGANTTAAEEESTAPESEMATNFIALPYATDPGTLEGGTVVRVTLSRAALASFGMPSAGLSSTDRIPADIALSEDGVPQAIRLVANANLDQPD